MQRVIFLGPCGWLGVKKDYLAVVGRKKLFGNGEKKRLCVNSRGYSKRKSAFVVYEKRFAFLQEL